MRKLNFAAALLLSSIMFFASAQETTKNIHILGVDDAVALAFENNISIKQSKINLDLLKKKKNSSWNSISPSMTISGNYGGSTSGTLEQWSNGDQKSGTSWSGTGAVNLSFTPALFTSIKAAQLAYEAGETSYENMHRTVELSVRKNFYTLLYTKENLTLQETALETARQTYEANKTKYNLGRLSQLDLLTSEYSYESKKPTIESLKNSYNNSLDSFKQALGIKLQDDLVLEGDLESLIDVKLDDSILTTNLDEIPSVKSVMSNIQIAKNNLSASRFTAYSPSVTASSNATIGGNDKQDDANLNVTYSLGVRIPLDGYLPWSNGALSVASQKANLESLKYDLENVKTTAAINVRNCYNAIIQAQAQLGNYERNANLMQRTYEMTRDSYNAGSASLSALQNAEDNLATAKYNLQAARFSIISAVLDLENTLGVPFGTFNSAN